MSRSRVTGLALVVVGAVFFVAWMVVSLAPDAFWGHTALGFSLVLLGIAVAIFALAALGIALGRRFGWPMAGVASVILVLIGLYGFAAYGAWEGPVCAVLGIAIVAVGLTRPRRAAMQRQDQA